MKAFWNEFTKKVGETADTVSAKASEVVELQKIKSQIRTLEGNNDSDYIELGKMIYDKYKAGEAVADAEKGFCEAIENREATIAELLQKMTEVKGDTACEICGKTVAKGMTYCPYCGAKTVFDEEDEVEVVHGTVEDIKDETEVTAEDVKEAIKEVVEEVKDKAEDVVDTVKDKAEDVVDTVKDKAEDVVETIKEKIE